MPSQMTGPGWHPCTAKGCFTMVPPEHLMCPPHWGMVPGPLKTRVWAAYRPGQTAGSASPEWHIAADDAAAAVARLERKDGTPRQGRLPGL
jgi:hypothetical protein